MPVNLTIVTPEGVRYDGGVDSVVVPGTEGDFGVLPGHERFLAPVRIGELEVRGGNDPARRWAAVSDGFADVSAERVVVLVDTCEFAPDIDEARAERARARAERELDRLRQDRSEALDFKLEEAALQRAVIRIQVSKKRGMAA
ncbi:MAG: ATP synthase F1 subunit epsilon [Deltaproteobacteria bacterium]|nr:ATP synthase F1 subunit epsilon [Deltaproteobacteria bacterium]